ncbi:MAG: UTP--glucose-1-phosphate uridylyltransferase [Bacilli bacterium]|nr:UTP--glucose-1-phosphate uridylyltransferase [Bacilli bacterium]
MVNLKSYNQEQILRYYDELDDNEKKELEKQIDSIDYELINRIYKNSYTNDVTDLSKISSLKIIKKEDTTEEDNITGENIIKNNEYAVVIMAGGFGSRLGLNKPKGCLELNINGNNISLFELYINELKEANKKYNSNINLYIMTSTSNNEDTIKFFEDNNYFDYKDNIKIFTQGNLPILDVNGKIVLKSKSEILFGPNGNGDVYRALKVNGLIDDMKNKGIKYALFTNVDNVLTNFVDTKFIGATINNNYSLATKTLTKTDENSKTWVFCKYNNRPYILQGHEITKEFTNTKENNEYVYRETNITYHLISIENIELFSNIDMKYHRAYKNNKFLDENGNLIETEDKNSFKFEKFIFDAFFYADDMLLYRIDESEFCPIKEQSDIEKAINALENKTS